MGMSELALTLCIFAAALLYSSVGHAGASGYLAAMALFGVAPETMRPAALILNILVASIASVRFYRAGYFCWPIFWPFAVASVPLAFLGGTLALPGALYKPIVGLALLFAAWRLMGRPVQATTRGIAVWVSLLLGAGIGLLSGLTGTGGGIFLGPLLILMGWADVRQASGVSAAFVLVNSVAGVLGVLTQSAGLPDAMVTWAIAAVLGGLIGSELGSRRLGSPALRRLLAVVLVIAGIKLILPLEAPWAGPIRGKGEEVEALDGGS